MAPTARREPNVLPDWWAFLFMGLQAGALAPLTIKNLTDPLGTFLGALPTGYDRATDGLRSSLRVEMTMFNAAQAYPMIAILFIGCVLFARNSLRGQPALQQRLVKLPIYVGLGSDVWLYTVLALKLPREVLLDPTKWTSNISGVIYGLPLATALKLVWLLGIGRDSV